MISTTSLTPNAAVAAALTEADIADAAKRGFKTIVNFRPEGETADQLTSARAKRAASAAGLDYAHIPAHKHDLFVNDIVTEMARILAAANGPVLAYCASGQRAAILWAAASARTRPVTEVLETLKAAGFDLDFLRDDLEAQADRARWADAGDAEPTPAPSSEPSTRAAA